MITETRRESVEKKSPEQEHEDILPATRNNQDGVRDGQIGASRNPVPVSAAVAKTGDRAPSHAPTRSASQDDQANPAKPLYMNPLDPGKIMPMPFSRGNALAREKNRGP